MLFRLPHGRKTSHQAPPPQYSPTITSVDALVARLFRAPVFSVTQEGTIEEACPGMIEYEPDEAAARREAYEELGCLSTTSNASRAFGRVPASPRNVSPCFSPPMLLKIGSARAVVFSASMKELPWLSARWSNWL